MAARGEYWTDYLVNERNQVIRSWYQQTTEHPYEEGEFTQDFGSLFLADQPVETQSCETLQQTMKDGAVLRLIKIITFFSLMRKVGEEKESLYWERWLTHCLAELESMTSRFCSLRMRLLQNMSEEEYLQTPEWKMKRESLLKQYGFRCKLCGRVDQLQVHHANYFRSWGQEWDSDLVVLCGLCHARHHGKGVASEMSEWR
jgi:hypothetical protein